MVSFGLVSIPVKLYSTAERSQAVQFHMVNRKTGARIKQPLVDASSGEVVPRSQVGKGYEFAKGQRVVLSDEEYKALLEVGHRTIELTEFVPGDSVSPLAFSRSYFLGTEKGGERAYHLLRLALQETARVGIARYSANGKQKLVMLRPHENRMLVMQQLHYQDEMVSAEDIPIAEVPAPSAEELSLAVQIIQQRAHETFEHGKYEDEVKKRILALIEEKIQGREITEEAEAAPLAQVIDLMDVLKKSLAASPKPATKKRRSAKRAAKSKSG
jgi:DNA end-binding protein Ku